MVSVRGFAVIYGFSFHSCIPTTTFLLDPFHPLIFSHLSPLDLSGIQYKVLNRVKGPAVWVRILSYTASLRSNFMMKYYKKYCEVKM